MKRVIFMMFALLAVGRLLRTQQESRSDIASPPSAFASVPTPGPTTVTTPVPTAVPTTASTPVPTTVTAPVPTAVPTPVLTPVPTPVPTAVTTAATTPVPTTVTTVTTTASPPVPTTVTTPVPTAVTTTASTPVPTTVTTPVPTAVTTTASAPVPTPVPTTTAVPTTAVRTPVPTAAPALKIATKDLPRCKEMADIYPGDRKLTKWVPKNCRLKDFSVEEKGKCIGEKGILVVTDSLGEAILRRVSSDFLVAKRRFKHIKERYPNAVHHMAKSVATSSKPMLKEKHLPFLRKASFVVLSNGLWDIGMASCGINHYFDFLRLKVVTYMKEMPANGTMVLYNIPYIHHREPTGWGTYCNPGPRVAAYREALKLVSACTGVGIFDTYQMQKQDMTTPDGIHASGKGNQARASVVYNMMCPPEKDRLRPFYPQLACTDEAIKEAKARWAAVPEAANRPKRCPYTRPKCYNSSILPW